MKRNNLIITFLMVFVLLGCPPPKARKKMPRIFALTYSMETRTEPSFLITDDFNRNHILDLVVVNSGGQSFSFYKGNGDGTFKDQRVFRTGRDPICLVSADFNHTTVSSTYDVYMTRVIDGTLVKVCAWYDNEWGFSNRMLDAAVALMNAK